MSARRRTVAVPDAYRAMATIRGFEERCLDLSTEGLIAGSVHTCAGQEAIPVGAMAALEERDRVVATYRGHGWAIACGVPLEELLGEICQRAQGVNGGRAGSPYLMAPQHGFVGENSIVGAGVPIGTGIALAASLGAEDRVVVVSIGDGALNQGATHEGLVFAAARDLPIIVVCENNGWAEMTRADAMTRGSLAERVAGYGIDSHVVDGRDPEAVRAAVASARSRIAERSAPVFLECETVRLLGHYNRDIEHYRPKEDRAAAERDEPLARMRAALGEGAEGELERIDAEISEALDAVVEAVRAMDEPDPRGVHEHVVEIAAAPPHGGDADPGPATEMPYVKAVTAALRTELAERPDVLVYGEDVGFAGGIFGATRGLQQEFGTDRVFDTPIAESAILGSAVGSAMSGLRPIVEIMWADFLLVALDQLINQAANARYVSRGAVTVPMVMRTQQGVTDGSCAQHSQCLEALLAHVSGLKVGLPATPHDAYAMLRAAIADPDPCMIFEARSLYQTKGDVHLEAPVEPVGGARLRREGRDFGIVTWGTAVAPALEAAEALTADGIDGSVLDLRWLRPLDEQAIADLVAGSEGRLLVVHEAALTGGFGAEIAAGIQERHFDELDMPVARVAGADAPMPSAPALQRALVPRADAIAAAVRRQAGAAVAS